MLSWSEASRGRLTGSSLEELCRRLVLVLCETGGSNDSSGRMTAEATALRAVSVLRRTSLGRSCSLHGLCSHSATRILWKHHLKLII